MLRHTKLEHRFVLYIPEQLERGVLYISMEYATAAHACCCGCGLQVITPFTPTDWKMTFDGETVSLWPSIGNWNFACRSHYIIRNSRIIGAEPWKDERINRGRIRDKQEKEEFYGKPEETDSPQKPAENKGGEGLGLWQRVKNKCGKRDR